MSNRLITIEEMAKDFDALMCNQSIDPKEFALALAYDIACAYDEDEERRVRVILGLESPKERICISCGSATQPCCGH